MLRLLTKKLKSQSLNDIKPEVQGSSFKEFVFVEESPDENITDDISLEDIEDNTHESEASSCGNKENHVKCVDVTTPECNNNSEQFNFLETLTVVSACSSNDIRVGGEKRKFSNSSLYNLKCSKIIPTYHCDSSSDEEIKELYVKHRCRNSRGNVIGAIKPNRKIMCIERYDATNSRPSLNFEKMRQKLLKRPQPRIVKLKTIQPSKTKELNEMVAFKPIKIISGNVGNINESAALVPVEEPSFVF